MPDIKTYEQVSRTGSAVSFRISRMEDIYDASAGTTDDPHRHDYYTVLLALEADGQHIIDFNEYSLADHQVFFISPGQVHQIIEQKRSVGYAMLFSMQFLAESNIPVSFVDDLNLFNDYGHSPPLEPDAAQTKRLSGCCEEIIDCVNAQHKFKDQAIGALLKLFLIQCNNICTLPFDDTHKLEAGNVILKAFKSLVNDNFAQWHATSQYALALAITPDHLNRTIKSLIGKTAKEYIQSRITTAAKRMLYFSDNTTKEIGYDLGFSEPANFSAFFKKCTGLSPSQFRERA